MVSGKFLGNIGSAALAVAALYFLINISPNALAFLGKAHFDVSMDGCGWSATCSVSYSGGEGGFASVELCTPDGCNMASGWKSTSITLNGSLPPGGEGTFLCDASDVHGEFFFLQPLTESCAGPPPPPAPEPADGACGPSSSNPVHYNCSSGVLGPTEEVADEYRWWCLGSNGGRDAFCAEKKLRFDVNPPPRGVCVGGDCPGISAPRDGDGGGTGGGNNGGGLFDWLTPLDPFSTPPPSYRNACTNDGACVRVRGSGPNQCSDPGNLDSSNCAQPAPSCQSFTSSPKKLVYPPAKGVTLSWTCTKAHDGCSISPGSLIEGGGQNLPQYGSVNTLPLSQTTDIRLICRGRGGVSPEYHLPLGALRVYQLSGGKIREVAP